MRKELSRMKRTRTRIVLMTVVKVMMTMVKVVIIRIPQ